MANDSARDGMDAPSGTPCFATSPSARALRSSPECGAEDVQRVSEGASAESGAATIADVAPEVLARYAVTFAKNSATPESTAHDTSVVVMDMQPTVLAVLGVGRVIALFNHLFMKKMDALAGLER